MNIEPLTFMRTVFKWAQSIYTSVIGNLSLSWQRPATEEREVSEASDGLDPNIEIVSIISLAFMIIS
jgi:hypothetical protein